MIIELEKTMGHDIGLRSGKSVFHKTIAKRSKSLQTNFLADVAGFLNEAGFAGTSVKEQLPVSRLLGYIGELGLALEVAAACGVQCVTTHQRDGNETVGILIHKV
jgi:hypothetical protein